MRAKITIGFLVFTLAGALAAAAAFSRDGAIVTNSGSTNTAGYQIKVWSDGSAQAATRVRRFAAAAETPQPHSSSISTDLTQKFFADVKAARDQHVQGHSGCMKSASFGSTTSVSWHGWISPDLSCPSDSAVMSALAEDVAAISSASGAQTGSRMMHLPINEPRRIEPTPQATASPGGQL
ncbi:MAG: hypothetical protein ABI182_01080 [Candidatus Baltobacteraceae bacterium]